MEIKGVNFRKSSLVGLELYVQAGVDFVGNRALWRLRDLAHRFRGRFYWPFFGTKFMTMREFLK